MTIKSVPILSLILLVTFFFIASQLNQSVVNALENNNGSDQIIEIAEEVVVLNFTGSAQTFPDKMITLKVVINPKLDVGKTTVAWIYNKDMFKIVGPSQDVVDLNTNQENVFYKSFNPNQKYIFNEKNNLDFGVRVATASYDRNYLSVRKLTLHLNSDFEAVPSLPGYDQQKLTINLVYIVSGIVATIIVIWLIIWGIRRFIKYLNTD